MTPEGGLGGKLDIGDIESRGSDSIQDLIGSI